MFNMQQKENVIAMADEMEKVLDKTIDELMKVALKYADKLSADVAVEVIKLGVHRFANTFDKAAAELKRTGLIEDDLKTSNNQT